MRTAAALLRFAMVVGIAAIATPAQAQITATRKLATPATGDTAALPPSPATADPRCDFNDDGRVDLLDFFLYADAFGGQDPTFDLDRNGRVELGDFFLFADNFGRPTGSPAAAPSSGPGSFTMEQTLSDNAQEMTIAFDALAFLTGNLGSDSFFPPGKVADFWGFQYLRDNDPSEMGHNTDFLTKASLNLLAILTADQKTQLITLAKSQVDTINTYGLKRFVLMTAFRRLLDGALPAGTTTLDEDAVRAFSAELYRLDGRISFARAQVMGGILRDLSTPQKAYLDSMVGKGMTSWPNVDEPVELRALTADEKVAVMTYAGDLFSWYAGSLEADVYFCPERQGTYFGSFYMKDAPAVGNPGYSIGTNITADMGKAFVDTLTAVQAGLITGLVDIQRPYLTEIVQVRRQVAVELRRFISGGSVDQAAVFGLMEQYGELDGSLVFSYATHFAEVGKTLTATQRTALMALRRQTLGDFSPEAAFLYAQSIPYPEVPDTDFLFR